MILFSLFLACSDVKDSHDHDHEQELITTVLLELDSTDGSESFVATWSDVEQSGAPMVDELILTVGLSYTLNVSFLNELESPAEDITQEIADEAEEHQIFFTGGAIDTLVGHSYLDSDANGLPVGLENELQALTVGSDTLTLTLRHLPPESDQAVKVDGLAEQANDEGLATLPGDSDVSVDFVLSVE